MSKNHEWRVEQLSPAKHERESFFCGIEELDQYLKKLATKDVKRKVSQVFVLVETKNSSKIIAYYSLSAASFARESLEEDLSKKLPYYPVPAVIIGRFAVDLEWQGKGIGRFLLMEIFSRILAVSTIIAVYAIIVDAKNEKAKAFYEQYGFIPFKENPFRLFIPLKVLEALEKK